MSDQLLDSFRVMSARQLLTSFLMQLALFQQSDLSVEPGYGLRVRCLVVVSAMWAHNLLVDMLGTTRERERGVL
jgi:hypothetical protein